MWLVPEMKALAKFGVLLAVFIIIGLLFSRINVLWTKCECVSDSQVQNSQKNDVLQMPTLKFNDLYAHFDQKPSNRQFNNNLFVSGTQQATRKWLSYQPPGNGWNNQRIAVENALVLATLLNRSLIVHPLAPHDLGNKLKAMHHLQHGYVTYNMMDQSDLLPLSTFMDLELMGEVTPVVEVKTSHAQFLSDYSYLTWKNVCHSGGFGYWMDQVPEHTEEVALFTRQKFTSLGNIWRDKCSEEKSRMEKQGTSSPIVRFVSDLWDDPSEMLYFEEGTLFGIQIRFSTHERALEAQHWVVNHVQYNKHVWSRVKQVADKIGGFSNYNAIQVRRKNHMASKLPPSFWIEQMIERNFSTLTPVFVATNDIDLTWFQDFIDVGFHLYFSTNFSMLDFKGTKETLQGDYLGIHEQCICEKANKFIPTPASTFNAFILRHRGEVKMQEDLMMESLHTYWIGHQLANREKPL